MPEKASVKYRSLRSNLVHLPLSLYASLAQQQAVRPLIIQLPPQTHIYSDHKASSSISHR